MLTAMRIKCSKKFEVRNLKRGTWKLSLVMNEKVETKIVMYARIYAEGGETSLSQPCTCMCDILSQGAIQLWRLLEEIPEKLGRKDLSRYI